MKPKNTLRRILAGSIAALLAVPAAHAATRNWVGGTDTVWATGANWGGTAPANNLNDDTANFNQATYGFAPDAGMTSINGITIGASNGAMTLTTTNLSIGNSGISIANGAGALTIAGGVTIGAVQSWANNSSTAMSTAGILTITNQLSLTAGTIQFGNFANTGAGGVVVNGATAQAGNDAAFGTGTLTLTSGTVSSDGGTARSFANALAINGSVTLGDTTNNGALTFTGGTTITGSNTVTLAGSGGATFSTAAMSLADGSNTTFSSASGALTLSGGFNTNTGTKTLTFDTGANAATMSGALTGSGTLVLAGSGTNVTVGALTTTANAIQVNSTTGGVYTFDGASTFTGGVTLTSGKLNINSVGVLSTNGPLGNGGTFAINGGTIDNTSGAAKVVLNVNPITVGGNFAFSTGGGTASNNLTLPGTVNLGGTTRIITTNGTGILTLSGTVSNGGLTKDGTGTLTLTGTKTYTGATTVNQGTLLFSNTSDLPTTLITNNSAVQFYSDGGGYSTAAKLTGGGTWTVDGPGGGTIFDKRVILKGTGSDNTGSISVINSGKLWVELTASNNPIGDTSDVSIASGAIFNLYGSAGAKETIGGLNGSGTVDFLDGGGGKALTLELGGGDKSGSFSGSIKNTGSFTPTTVLSISKTGFGTQILSGTNTYTGTTTVNGGVLSTGTLAANGSNSGIGTGTALTLNGGTLRYTGGNNGSDAGAKFNRTITVGASGGTLDNAGSGFAFYSGTLSGSGALAFLDTSGDANNQQWLVTGNSPGFSGAISIGNGTANSGFVQQRTNAASPLGTGTITLNGGGLLTADNGSTNPSTLSNAIILNGGTLVTQAPAMTYSGTVTVNASTTSSVGHAFNGAGDVVLSGNISGSGTISAIGGSGVFLSGDNSGFTGTWQSTSAQTWFNTATAGSAAAKWVANGSNFIGNIAGGGTVSLGELSGTTGTLKNDRTGTTFTFSVGALNTNSSFSGGITDKTGDPTSKTALTKVGTGTQTLGGTNTYTGGTRIDAGTLSLGHATDTLSSSSAVTVDGATAVLSIAGNSDTVGAVSLKNGGSITGTGGTLTGTSYAVESGSVSAKLGGAGIALTKSTAGTVTLSGTNSYTGATTVSAGTLLVSGSLSGTTLVDVNDTATLGGSAGTIGTNATTVNVNLGGTLAPGASIGTLNVGTATGNTVNFAGSGASKAVLSIELDALSSSSDLLFINGNLNLGADDQLTLSLLNGSTATGAYTIASYTGTLTGTFDNIVGMPSGYDINYGDGSNDSITIIAVPEPGAAVSLLGGLGLLLGVRRRRSA